MQNEIWQIFTTKQLWVSSGFTSLIWVACIWLFRKLIYNYFSKRIQNKFDEKLEKTRSELRQNENEISDIRKIILNNISSKGNVIWSRKIKAVDNLWNSFIKLKSNLDLVYFSPS